MSETAIIQQLAFVVAQRNTDETLILAEVVREGIQLLYLEAVTEAFLHGTISRDIAIQALGVDQVVEIEYTRDALQRDITRNFRVLEASHTVL